MISLSDGIRGDFLTFFVLYYFKFDVYFRRHKHKDTYGSFIFNNNKLSEMTLMSKNRGKFTAFKIKFAQKYI